MKRSSSDDPPRVGMVVRYINSNEPRVIMTILSWGSGKTDEVGARQMNGRPANPVDFAVWCEGEYDIISEPAETCAHEPTCVCQPPTEVPVMLRHPLPASPCNCPQSLALLDAMRRIVAAVDSTSLGRTFATLTEVNLIAQEALK